MTDRSVTTAETNVSDSRQTFELKYVGTRFDGARLPLDVLQDLPAFRELLVAYTKAAWKEANPTRKRLPRGFDKSLTFDLIKISDGSAVPCLEWNRRTAQLTLPGLSESLELLLVNSYEKVLSLFSQPANDDVRSLSPDKLRALNRFGASLRPNERIEFVGFHDDKGAPIFVDADTRGRIIAGAVGKYEKLYEDTGVLAGTHASGIIYVDTPEFGELSLEVGAKRVIDEFDGNIGQKVQFEILIEVGRDERPLRTVEVVQADVVDADMDPGVERCRARVAELQQLSAGWHDGEGAPPTKMAAEAALALLEGRPQFATKARIYPMDSGGLMIEFDQSGWDVSVEFHPTGGADVYAVEISGEGELEPVNFGSAGADLLGEIVGLLDRVGT